ncbi:MAG: hypothetical protein O7D30_08115, partial [Rickettsia endosymbiont of Ixodes persulcatus]|nr:hypothetical protein [Rickettsia endosymbiont of Ixodes persulcatus]
MINKEKRFHYLKKMEIPVWTLKENDNKLFKETVKDNSMPRKTEMTHEQKISALDWQALRLAVNNCKACN